uniref:Uncharacterized protein n=1 Tax=Solanum tuberosum TaxID=4113 RepID=M1B790_SOLTU
MSERIILIVCVVTRQADLEDTSAATVETHTQQESTVLKKKYFEKKHAIVDSLAESLYFVQDDDFISFIHNRLDSLFGIFKAALNMHSGTITPEELFGLLLQEEERLAEELRSTTINTQFGVAPSHALLTYNSSFLHPAPPININKSSILGPPPLT